MTLASLRRTFATAIFCPRAMASKRLATLQVPTFDVVKTTDKEAINREARDCTRRRTLHGFMKPQPLDFGRPSVQNK